MYRVKLSFLARKTLKSVAINKISKYSYRLNYTLAF